jgi:hypothetical protein
VEIAKQQGRYSLGYGFFPLGGWHGFTHTG